MAGNQIRVGFGITGVSKAESDLDKLKNKITGIKAAGVGGVTKGVALGIGIGVVNQATLAVSELGNVIGDAVKAAEEDEASQQKLNTALKANVEGWDGNTAAIEKTLAARQKLGFSDDEQRDSLAKIVAATHDVNKALDVQRTAMDLARFKGISLADAGDALIKVEGGQYRALKALGIVLKEGATQQDALNAVQKVATGQAEDYAKTSQGKMLVAQVKVNEAMEKLGYVLLPIVADAASKAADIIENLVGGFDDLNTNIKNITGSKDPLGDLGTGLDALAGTMLRGGNAALYFRDKQNEMIAAAKEAKDAADDQRESAKIAAVSVTTSAGRMGDAMTGFASETHTATDDVKDYWSDMTDAIVDDVQTAIDDAFGPMRAQADILAAEEKLHAAETAINEGAKGQAYRDARDDITSALEDEAGSLKDLGKEHKLSKAAVEKYKKDTVAAYKAMGKSVPPEIQKVIDQLEILADYDNGGSVKVNIHATVTKGAQGHHAGKGGPNEGKTAGGPVEAGEAYTVGENGPETLVMGSQPGRIIPNGGSTTVNIYGADVSSPSRLAEVVRRAMTISQGAPWETGGAMR